MYIDYMNWLRNDYVSKDWKQYIAKHSKPIYGNWQGKNLQKEKEVKIE